MVHTALAAAAIKHRKTMKEIMLGENAADMDAMQRSTIKTKIGRDLPNLSDTMPEIMTPAPTPNM